ncbi:MAG: aminotransferase class III-fold pyridoxal phosphate-dependent enzyme [Proteobacteria bacterium]|nr:aminotransferase class III-fold pyridoxal phosphate-dependent enzyme [Pseudomonadota bacterium]
MGTESSRKHSDNSELIRRRREHFAGSFLFYKDPVDIVRGEGIWLFDRQGNRYLDCYNNVASVGHCHPKVVEALSTQAATLNTHTRYLHQEIVDYSQHLASTMPPGLDVCLFCCTGTEANELAMRIARCVTGNYGAIILEHSYHGNSTLIGELSACTYPPDQRPDYVATVEPPNTYCGTFRRSQGADDGELARNYAQLAETAIAQLKEAEHGVAAFICDAIFDIQGTLDAPRDYFKLVYEKIRAAGGLCIADEVQPGFGRLGEHMWGFQHYDVVPDIVTLGKPMGGGHPVAGVVTSREIANKFMQSIIYFNTFGGNPVSAAVAEAVLSVIEEEDLQRNAREVGAYLRDKLDALAEKYTLIGDIRGRGLFFGVELVKDRDTLKPAYREARSIAEKMKDEGILIGSTGRFGNVVKIRPPLVFSKENADLLVEKLDKLLAEVTVESNG